MNWKVFPIYSDSNANECIG